MLFGCLKQTMADQGTVSYSYCDIRGATCISDAVFVILLEVAGKP